MSQPSPISPFRWGILGVARINRALVGPLRQPGHALLAVASRSDARAQAYADEQGIPTAYGSYEALLADPRIDAVYIPLPNHLHVEWSLRAAAAGKHVLCEKPLSLDGAGVRALQDASARHGVVITEAFMYRHHALTARVRALTQDGTIGVLQAIRGVFSFVFNRPDDTRMVPEYGGGSLWDIGCYPVSYATAVTGTRPELVWGDAVWSDRGVDLSFFGHVRFPDGVRLQFSSSFESPLRTEMEFIGTAGRLVLRRPFKPGLREEIEIHTGDDAVRVEHIDGDALYTGEVRDVAEAARSGRAPTVTLDESRHIADTLAALLESARTGQPQRV